MKDCFYILLVLLAATSCHMDEPQLAPDCTPSHTLLVYVGTDNNLAGYEQGKLQAIREGWSGKPTDRIIVYRDTRNAAARLMEISNLAPNKPVREIAVYGTENSASPEVFSRVVNDVKAMFPADSYGLLVFSHASGWLPTGALSSPAKPFDARTIIVDGTDEMGLSAFAAAIPDRTFDYIVFEACFMAGIEVAYELRHKTPLILASSAEILHPGFAPVYQSSIVKLLTGNIQGFGQQVFNKVLTYAGNSTLHSATYSVIRTAGLEQLAAFVKENCDFSYKVTISNIQHFDRFGSYRLFFDFEDYYSRLLETNEHRAELSRLIANCVPWKAATGEFMTQSGSYSGFTVEQHSGLTTYVQQSQFPGLNAEYEKTEWKQAIK